MSHPLITVLQRTLLHALHVLRLPASSVKRSNRQDSNSCNSLTGASPAGAIGAAVGEADDNEIQAMGEFDLGEDQAGEGGEGFMDLGADIGNKVGLHDQLILAMLPVQ